MRIRIQYLPQETGWNAEILLKSGRDFVGNPGKYVGKVLSLPRSDRHTVFLVLAVAESAFEGDELALLKVSANLERLLQAVALIAIWRYGVPSEYGH
jgi:hypothetical protein